MSQWSPHACPDEPVGGRLVAALLDRAARALPAVAEGHRHGWWLRHTDSDRWWWSGAALAHGANPGEPVAVGIAAAETFYADRDAVARFQVCAGCPRGLDRALARRGYELTCPTSLQVVAADDVADRLSAPVLETRVGERLDSSWFATWRAANATTGQHAPEWRLLQRVPLPSGYVTVADADRPIAVGRAVADGGWTGVFDMVTAPEARGRGAAKAVLSAIARWAVHQRASRIYLQVERDNAAARRLYAAAGFSESATYHYRVRRARPFSRTDRPRVEWSG